MPRSMSYAVLSGSGLSIFNQLITLPISGALIRSVAKIHPMVSARINSFGEYSYGHSGIVRLSGISKITIIANAPRRLPHDNSAAQLAGIYSLLLKALIGRTIAYTET